MAVGSEGVIEISLPLELTTPLVEQALRQIGATITNRQHTKVFAHKGTSFKSWGEDIAVSISQISSGISRVHIISESSLRTSLFDFGVNSGNIEKFGHALRPLALQAESVWQEKMVLEGTMCPKCRQQLQVGTQFCPNDGTQITHECSKCGHHNTPGAKFCSKCGASMEK